VYRSFEDLNAFSETVQRLQSEPPPEGRRKQLSLIPESEPPAEAPRRRGPRKS
jgi:hypothetical protein